MVSVNIFGWKLSTIIIEGSFYYIVDDNLFKLFGYVNNKSRVGYLKELCFSKSQSYPLILRDSGNIQPSTGNVRKSACKLMCGEKYILTPDMLSSMLMEKQPQGEARLRSVVCQTHFVEELFNIIRAPSHYTQGVSQELSVSCAKYSSTSSPPSTPPSTSPLTLPSTPPSTSSLLDSFMPIPKPLSRKRKTTSVCACRGIFKRQRIVSDNASARSKRRRVLASKRLFAKLGDQLPSNISLGKVEFDVKTTKAGDESVHVVLNMAGAAQGPQQPLAITQRPSSTTPESTPALPLIASREAEIQVAVMDQKLVSKTQYHELSMTNSEMVRSYKVDAAKKVMSSCITVNNFNGEDAPLDGCYRDVKDILDYLFTIPEFCEPLQNMESPVLRLRFAGDGARTSRNKNTVVLLFSIIDEGTSKRSL